MNPRPNLIFCRDAAEAQQRASAEATQRQAVPLVGNVYRQGPRYMFNTAMDFHNLVTKTKTDPAKKGDDPSEKRNRPIDSKHSKGITNYLKANETYILPPFVICTPAQFNVYVGAGSDDEGNPESFQVLWGFAVIPSNAMFWIQDGQHRREAVSLDELLNGKLSMDGAAVVIICEDDIEQIQQDFADCASVKPISPALLAAYNHRDPLSCFMREVVALTPILNGRIEKVSKTIGVKSDMLYTTNNLRQGIATLLTGNRQNAGKVGETTRPIEDWLGVDAETDEARTAKHESTLRLVSEFFNVFASSNPQWSHLLACNLQDASVVIRQMRNEYLQFSATGLLIIAEVGHDIIALHGSDEAAKARWFTKLGNGVDWKKTAMIWQGNVITPSEGGKKSSVMNQSRALLTKACDNLRRSLGLPLKSQTPVVAEQAVHGEPVGV